MLSIFIFDSNVSFVVIFIGVEIISISRPVNLKIYDTSSADKSKEAIDFICPLFYLF